MPTDDVPREDPVDRVPILELPLLYPRPLITRPPLLLGSVRMIVGP